MSAHNEFHIIFIRYTLNYNYCKNKCTASGRIATSFNINSNSCHVTLLENYIVSSLCLLTIISLLVYLCFCSFVYLGYEGIMMFNATFNNISAISRQSILLVEETGEHHSPAASHWHTSSRVHLAWPGFELTTLMVIGTNCIRSHNPTPIRSCPQRLLVCFFVFCLVLFCFCCCWKYL